MDRIQENTTTHVHICVGCSGKLVSTLSSCRSTMKTLLCLVVLGQITSALGEESPFITRSDATQVLGRMDLGRYRELSAQLGLRNDIGEGWEEILSPTSYDKDAEMTRLYSAMDPSWFEDDAKQRLMNKIIFGSIAGLNSLHPSPFSQDIHFGNAIPLR